MDNQTVIPQKVTTKLNRFRKNIASHITPAIIRVLSKTSVTPNILTVSGFIVTLAAAGLILTNHLFAAGFVVIAAGFFDMLDGSLARLTNRVTKFGGILDSTLDRLSEASLLLALLVMFGANGSQIGIWLTGIGLISSLMVSYIRSRAETAGITCDVGLFTRSERVIALTLGLLLSSFGDALLIMLGIIAAFSIITVIQRFLHAWKKTR